MRRFIIFPGVVLATLALVLATAGTSQGAFNKDELKCRKGIAKNFSKAIATAQKITSGCHKRRNAGKGFMAADNCNDLAVADTKNKFAKAQGKITAQIQKCLDSGIDRNIRKLFINASCPEPCRSNLGLSPSMSYAELGTCLACYAGEVAQGLSANIQGSPAGVPMASKDDQKCHQTIGKSYGKLLKTILKERTKCQNSADKAGAMTVAETGCASADPKNKIGKAVNKAAADINKSCATATLANLDSCSAVDLPSLIACLDGQTNTSGDTAMLGSYELPAALCPVQLDSTIMSGQTTALGGGLAPTRSFLELGWTGIAHLADVPDNYTISSELACAAAPPCGDCTLTGLSINTPQYSDFTRCENDFSVPCTNLFGPDPACGGAECKYMLGPPLPTSTGNNPTCAVNILNVDITGTANPDVGSGVLDVDLRTRVFLGASATQPCPLCGGTCTAPPSNAGQSCGHNRDCNNPVGTPNGVCGNFDTTPKDGVQNGTCFSGAKDGSPCDISGFSPTFAAQSENIGVSLDCPPDLQQNISGTGLVLPLELTTGTTSLGADNSCDGVLNFLSCFCGQCSGSTALPCRNDAECVALGAGTCTSPGGGVNRQPNGCTSFACTPLADDKGECTTGPDNKFCDGEVDVDGNGFIGCNTNSDCDTLTSVCGDGGPSSCGACTITRRRSCFLDPIVDQGVPDVNNPLLVSTFCLPPTNNASLNGVTGSPGPVRLGADMLTELLF